MINDKLDYGLTNRYKFFYFCYENGHWLQKDDSQVDWDWLLNNDNYVIHNVAPHLW